WEALILGPVCGFGCAMETLDGVVLPMVIGAVAVMAVMAMFDYLVQRSEFMREQMMTKSEYKREMKEATGDPHLKGALKRDRKQMLTTTSGPGQATIIVSAGSALSVGIRYVHGETPAPILVARAKGLPAVRGMAKKSGAYEHSDPDLVKALSRVAVGSYITDDALIAQIAPVLQQAAVRH
ncbi:MAG: EscU/YscU/HrcU family type III secretion system export apparatus switch protein, partial [Pseudomonadota bacterium]